jgi:hypothetical protein
MKNLKVVILAIVCIVVICGGFYLYSQNQGGGNKDELTDVQKIILHDFKKDYPPSPREVAKWYNRIVAGYHHKDTTPEQLGKLVDQMILLFDEDFKVKVPRNQYYNSVAADVKAYEKAKMQITLMNVCDTDQVRYSTDDRNDDKLAFVDIDYFVKTDGQLARSYMTIGMRQDEDGRWKIVGVTLRKGESSNDD